MSETIHELPATAVPHGEAVTRTRDAEPGQQVEVSVYLKPRAARSGGAAARAARWQTREQLRARRAVEHAADISAVGAFAARHGLRVAGAEPGRRRVRLAGPAAEFGAAFPLSWGCTTQARASSAATAGR